MSPLLRAIAESLAMWTTSSTPFCRNTKSPGRNDDDQSPKAVTLFALATAEIARIRESRSKTLWRPVEARGIGCVLQRIFVDLHRRGQPVKS